MLVFKLRALYLILESPTLADASALMTSFPLSQHFADFHGNVILTLSHICDMFPLKTYFDLFMTLLF